MAIGKMLSPLYVSVIMAALWNREGHYIFIHVVSSIFLLLSFSSPNLSGRRLDVYHTSTHDVALVRIQNLSEMCCTRLAENTGSKKYAKSPFAHHRTALLGYIFATNAFIDNGKNLFNSNTSS